MEEALIIDGKKIADSVKQRVKSEVERFNDSYSRPPALATVLVGEDPASHIYVGKKKEACAEVGINSLGHELPAQVSQTQLLELVEQVNRDEEVDGILVQLPLPEQIDSSKVMEQISPAKDVDGLTTYNAGRLVQGRECLVPCTPNGVIEILNSIGVEISGSEAVIVGRSDLVGRPLSSLLLARDATVTLCHSKTRELAEVCSRADILVAAVGVPHLITAEMVKPGAVVIDVGTTRVEGGLAGDVDFDSVREKVSAITPVPGGVGPMTIAMLMANTVKAANILAS